MSAAQALAGVLRAAGGRSPLTGPLTLAALEAADTRDPAHWWPGYHEPVYAELYAERLDQLAAGLLIPALTAAEASPAEDDPHALTHLVEAIRAIDVTRADVVLAPGLDVEALIAAAEARVDASAALITEVRQVTA